MNAYAAEVRRSRRALRAFGRDAAVSKGFNMAVSAVEGVGMGILGMGIPDIPLFLGVLFRVFYEIALSYGFSDDTDEEQIFILKLIQTAVSHDRELAEGNMELNLWMKIWERERFAQSAANRSGARRRRFRQNFCI